MKEKDEGRRIGLKSFRPQHSLKILEQAGWEMLRVPSQEAMPALVHSSQEGTGCHQHPVGPEMKELEAMGQLCSLKQALIVSVLNY